MLRYSLLLLLTVASAVPAATILVTDDSDNITNDGNCTLREAIGVANNGVPPVTAGECGFGLTAPFDIIDVPAGTYLLTLPGADDDVNASGDFDIRTATLHVRGVGPGLVVVRGDGSDRVFDVIGTTVGPPPKFGSLILEGMTIRNGGGIVSGGGVRVSANAALTVRNCEIANNDANLGAGIALFGAGVALDVVTFHGNAADTAGGAVEVGTGAALFAKNVTINGNESVGSGSAIDVNGSAHLNNVTISGNIADSDFDGDGDGALAMATGSLVDLANSIIAGNADLSGAVAAPVNPDCAAPEGTVITAGYNLIGNLGTACTITPATGDQFGSAANPIDARLQSLGMYGGTTETQPPAADSPAVDAGNPAQPGGAYPACASLDQRGNVRPIGVACDIGAIEADDRLFADGFE
jgi:hypothetical protein